MQRETMFLMRPGEAAVALGIGRSKVYELISVGEIPTVRIGRSVRIPVAELHQWISNRTQYKGSNMPTRCTCQVSAAVRET